jgi:predicted nucleic acid-binding protein
VKAFFDTSVLLPVFYGDHPCHEQSLETFLTYGKSETACAAHSAAELYATMTRLPVRPRIGADQAMLFIESLSRRVTMVCLESSDYLRMLSQAAEQQLTGGIIYDALIAACARKAGASVLYTWNPRDFQRLLIEGGPAIRTPAER